jgi:hypothetical protein
LAIKSATSINYHRAKTVQLEQEQGLFRKMVNYPAQCRSLIYTKYFTVSPAEQLSDPKLVINLKTAEQLGITIPPNVLVRATEVAFGEQTCKIPG